MRGALTRSAGHAAAAAALLTALAVPTAARAVYEYQCQYETTYTWVCIEDPYYVPPDTRCWWDAYQDWVCRWVWVPDPPPPPPNPDPSPVPDNYIRDVNYDGIIDSWGDVVSTSDGCAGNFDTNDRLGTQFGGTNSIRPAHRGVDIQCNSGDSVYNVFGGQVTSVNRTNPTEPCGLWVVVTSGDYTTTYCHLESMDVAVDQIVPAGGRIGACDNTGNSTGHHLHLVFLTPWGRDEYFWYTNYIPRSWNFDPNGC